jgi:hypothetical protein
MVLLNLDGDKPMNKCFVSLPSILVIGTMLYNLIDLNKRDFANNKLKHLYALLTIFPPIIGPIFYYLFVIKKNKNVKISFYCPKCHSSNIRITLSIQEWAGLVLLLASFFLLSLSNRGKHPLLIIIIAMLGLFLILLNINKANITCYNCKKNV